MKTIATLALIMALLGFPAVNANADTFTLWEMFPYQVNGDNYFYTAGFNDTSGLIALDYVSDYNFSRDSVVVKRADTAPWGEPWISLQSSSTESAILYGIPPEADSLHIYGQFVLGNLATEAHVSIGIALVSDPTQFDLLRDKTLTSSDYILYYDISNILIDPSHALVFTVDTSQAYLTGTIESSPVPVPASLLLLGSGLLGLAGWRRRPWLK